MLITVNGVELRDDDIAHVLKAMGRDTAWRQYIKVLVAGARIEGVDFSIALDDERLLGEGLQA